MSFLAALSPNSEDTLMWRMLNSYVFAARWLCFTYRRLRDRSKGGARPSLLKNDVLIPTRQLGSCFPRFKQQISLDELWPNLDMVDRLPASLPRRFATSDKRPAALAALTPSVHHQSVRPRLSVRVLGPRQINLQAQPPARARPLAHRITWCLKPDLGSASAVKAKRH